MCQLKGFIVIIACPFTLFSSTSLTQLLPSSLVFGPSRGALSSYHNTATFTMGRSRRVRSWSVMFTRLLKTSPLYNYIKPIPNQEQLANSLYSADDNTATKDVDMAEANPSDTVATHDYFDDDDNNDLTPPPESPTPPPSHYEDTVSRSSEPPVGAEDEIVVNNARAVESPAPADQEDVEMADSEGKPRRLVVLSSKRKRVSTGENVRDDISASPAAEEWKPRKRQGPGPKKTHGVGNVKSVKLGYWRDSIAEDKRDAHSVIGFIDVRDRLRTKIETVSRDGRSLIHRYPLPPGPGGSWVTFDKIVFDPHLVNLDHFQVKEYVKVRYEQMQANLPDVNSKETLLGAVQQAIERVKANPPPETNAIPAIAYGPDIPDHVITKPEPKRRKVISAAPIEDVLNAVDISGRPSRVVVGTWKHSSSANRKDRHAVQGILAQNENFRCKIVNQSPDGKEVGGNFPLGAGQIWCQWEDVDFLDHLQGMSRPQIKEYVRVRQRMIDMGELPEDRAKNDQLAVDEALRRHAQGLSKDESMTIDDESSPALPMRGTRQQQEQAAMNGNTNGGGGYDQTEDISRPASVPPPQQHESANFRPIRQSTRAPRHSLPDVQFRAANRGSAPQQTQAVVDRLERTNSIAQREIARVEASQMRADQRAANRGFQTPTIQPYPMHPPPNLIHNPQHPHLIPMAPPSGSGGRPSSRAASAAPSRNGTPTSFPPGHTGLQYPQGPHNGGPHNGGPHHNNGGVGSGSDRKSLFDDNIQRLNRVWAAQEANRIKFSQAAGETITGVNDAKIYAGIKYERKSSGPFEGKLVSQGTIINIDGEDYVEYRVLTKPSFF
ncbi:unnamed protein product [Sordaria macrospora k-hell]|uniref:WGS project CABT00000000 data, contig 2.3 n=2 Tax=Sordaria macrospora TaxID=5147 RepID=F7VP00_SORMK|nr:uncharacterized protein SMAC_06255 [Sordaria macrospora k-hell]CCC07227.1 unnamed protein product [Sordaria macrospora k-hell]